jgi:hypothetical protein
MIHTLPNVSSIYGAPMGRSDTPGDTSQPVSFTLIQLQWEDGDYDTGGAYWGGGDQTHIYQAIAEQGDDSIELFHRAASFSEAEKQILAVYPLATFDRQEQESSEPLYWFSSSSGRIELQMTLAQAESMSHSGQCDSDVAAGRECPSLAAQLAAIDPADLQAELKEYGCWNAEELSDHNANLDRILWLAAIDIQENATVEAEQ